MKTLAWRKRLGPVGTTVVGLAVLLAVALALRLWGIERYGLWIDEIATTQCLNFDLFHLLDCRRAELGSPLPHVATNIVYSLFGRAPFPIPEWIVRLPAVLAGTLAVLASWLAGRELLGTRGAWLYTVLWTFSPVAVAYSQEARMYAWLLLFSNLSTWLLMLCLTRRTVRLGVLFGLVAALNFYSHYLGVFVIVGQFLFAVLYIGVKWKSPVRQQLMRSILCASIVTAGLILPWLPYMVKASQVHLLSDFYTRIALTPLYALNAQAWVGLNVIELPAAAVMLFAVEILGVWWLVRNRRAPLLLAACWIAVPLGYLLVRHAGFSSFRYWTVILAPIYWILTAGGLALAEWVKTFLIRQRAAVDTRVSYALIGTAAVLTFVPWLVQFYAEPFESWRFDDWRGAAQFLRTHADADDLVISFGDGSPYHKLAFDFYLPSSPSTPRVIEPNELNGTITYDAQNSVGRAWGIVYAREPQGMERLRAQGGTQMDFYLFKSLVLISPRPLSAQETVSESAERLVQVYRAWDSERLGFARAILRDTGHGKNLLLNPKLEPRRNGRPRDWVFGAVHGQVLTSDAEPTLILQSARDDGTVVAQQELELQPEHFYMFRFECRSTLTRGAQRTYVTFNSNTDGLVVFPNGAGDVCPNDRAWHAAAFVLRVPASTEAPPRATVLLRNAGIGDAYWRSLSLYEIPAP